MSTNFNPAMLKLGREWKGYTQATLAEAAGVTQALVSKMEHGLINQPSEEAVSSLGNVLQLPPSFFFQDQKAIGLPHFHYRKRQKLGAKTLAQIEAVINIRRLHIAKLLRSHEVDTLRPIPMIDLDQDGVTPEKVAERLREYWMIPRGPIESVTQIIEQAGGIVVLAKFGTQHLDGISFRSEGMPPLFFMNNDVPGERFRFSLAHELGHMVMHYAPDDDGKLEEQADRFAAAFLMPAKEIRPYLSDPKISALGRVKAFWKVSIKALIHRTHDLKLVTPSQYKWMCIQYNKVCRDSEPGVIDVEKPTRLAEMVQFHLERLGYSLSELADLLCMLPEDVERHYLPSKPGLRLIISN